MHTRLSLVSATLIFLLSSTAIAAAEFKLVRELHKTSPWPGMGLAGDAFYTTDTDKEYRSTVEIYSADGSTHLKSVTLQHSATFMSTYGDKGVIVNGRTSKAWESHMTMITRNGTDFDVRHYNMGEGVIAESSVSDGNNIYFNEKGSRGLFKFVGGRLLKLPFEVSGPGRNMRLLDGKLYVVELRDLFTPGDESIVEFDINANQGRRLTDNAQLYGLRNVTLVDGMVAGTETYSNEVVFIDLKSNKIFGRHKIKPGAYGIGTLGRCAAAVSDESKSLTFLRAGNDGVEVVGGWDLNPAGDRLKQPRSLAVDEQTGRIFVRSNYICSSCTVTQSSVFIFDDGGDMLATCQ